MKINYINKLNNSLELEIEPVKCNNALIDSPLNNNNDKFTDNIDLIVINNYNEDLYELINKDSLKGLSILNIDSGDVILIEGVSCKVIVVFDGFLKMEAPELGEKPLIKFDPSDDFPF